MSLDIARWSQLSPLLDDLLDLDAPARADRLAALRAEDAALADDLQELLRRDAAMDAQAGCLASPALRGGPAVQAGQTLGAYTLMREIGQGGMGTVWLARRTDGRFEGQVAIKFLNTQLLGQGGAGRFAREGQILAKLAHPNIARLIDAGVTADGGPPYLVLEYVDGLPITTFCDQAGLGVAARLNLFLAVLAAVAHAHNRLILHRDLKPSNILVSAAGEVKLLDFGIAKLLGDANATAADDLATVVELTKQVGNAYTPNYAAPEQVQGGEVTTATDVYALGVLLYLLLSGQHPTAAAADASPLERLRTVIETEPKRLSEQVGMNDPKRARELRGDLDTLVARALKKAPAERYANAAALADDVRRWLAHEPIAARPDSAAYRLAKFVRRHRLGVAAGSVAGLALATSIVVVLWEARKTERQRVQAEGLIEFMLGDLRKKLEPVGRLDALDSVGARALTFYAQQDAGAMDPDSLGRRSRALHLLGEVAEKRGNLDEAERMFREAAESTAELLARSPKEGQRVFDHSQSVYWVGFVAWRRGQAQEATVQFKRYLSLAQELARLAPDKLDWRMEEGYASMNLGVLLLESGQATEALGALEDASKIWAANLVSRPALAMDMGATLGWIAKAHESLGNYAAAVLAQQSKLNLSAPKPGLAEDRGLQELHANAQAELSSLQLSLGQLDKAALMGGAAVQSYRALAALDPENLDWQSELCFAHLSLGEVLWARGELNAARQQLVAASPMVTRLLAQDASKALWQVRLNGRAQMLRARLAPSEQFAQTIVQLRLYLDGVQRFETGEKKLKVEHQRVVAEADFLLGSLLADAPIKEPDMTGAQQHWARTVQRLQAGAAAGEPPTMAVLASAQLRLGAAQEAMTWAEKLEASSYRHPQYIALRQALPALKQATTKPRLPP